MNLAFVFLLFLAASPIGGWLSSLLMSILPRLLLSIFHLTLWTISGLVALNVVERLVTALWRNVCERLYRKEQSIRTSVHLHTFPLHQDIDEQEETVFPGHFQHPSVAYVSTNTIAPRNSATSRTASAFNKREASTAKAIGKHTFSSLPNGFNRQPPSPIPRRQSYHITSSILTLDVKRKAPSTPPNNLITEEASPRNNGTLFPNDHVLEKPECTSDYKPKPFGFYDRIDLQTCLDQGEHLTESRLKRLESPTASPPLPETPDIRSKYESASTLTLMPQSSPCSTQGSSSTVPSTSNYWIDLFNSEDDLYCDDEPRSDDSSESINSPIEEDCSMTPALDAEEIPFFNHGESAPEVVDIPEPSYVKPEDVEMGDAQVDTVLFSFANLTIDDQRMEEDLPLTTLPVLSSSISEFMDVDSIDPIDVEMQTASFEFSTPTTLIGASGRPIKAFKPRLQGLHALTNQDSQAFDAMYPTSSDMEFESTTPQSVPHLPAHLKGRKTANLRRARR